MAGRPTKFTPEMADALVEATRDGMTLKDACTLCRVGEATVMRWLAMGKVEEDDITEDGHPDAEIEAYRDFRERWYAAGVEILQTAGRTIRQEIEAGDVKTAAWLLARKRPAQWGNKVEVTVDGKVDVILDLTRKAEERMARRAAEQEALGNGAIDTTGREVGGPEELPPAAEA